MNRTRIWIAASALLAVLVLAGYATAHVLSGDAEVRISARVLDDGRTEFALQQRSDGEWGDRVLPRARFFPADAEQDQWLNSTPLSIETAGHESEELRSAKEELAATQAELKTATMSLEEASTELAKYTAPIVRTKQLEIHENGRVQAVVLAEETFAGSETTILISHIEVLADGGTQGGFHQPPSLLIYCIGGQRDLGLANLRLSPGQDEWGNEAFEASFSIEPTAEDGFSGASDESWHTWQGFRFSDTGTYWSGPPASNHMYHRLVQADSITITLIGADDEQVEVTYSLDGVFETPIQPNIDRCGGYY